MSRQITNKQRAILIAKQSLYVLWIGFKWIFIFCLVCGFLAGGAIVGYVTALVKDDEVRPASYILKEVNKNSETGFVYFRDGTLVGQLRTDEDRRVVDSINEIPQLVRDAFIAIEDFRFENHYGVDLIGTMRAAKQKFLNEDKQTGGSTITQQLARRVFLSLEQTDSRKFKEIFLALRMERIMTKNDILLAYLNKMPFGNGSSGYQVFGIKAAAKGIFDIDDLNELNLAQAAYLAGLMKAPSEYSAFTGRGAFDEDGFNKAMDRQRVVLMRMLEVGKITEEEHRRALAFDVKSTLAPTKEKAYTTYPYLMIEAEKRAAEALLMQNNPELTEADLRTRANAELVKNAIDMMNRSGYKIYTTIDKTMYDAMQEIGRNPDNYTPDSPDKGVEQTAAIMIENSTGQILAMLEGRDYYIEQLNHATQMKRQPGSAMKLAAYLPALEMGIIQPGTPIDDAPIILKDGGKGAHIPDNWDDKFHGLVSARVAFNQSYNIPAIKLFLSEYGGVGIDTAWDYAKRMGITTLTSRDYQSQTGIIGGLTEGVTVEELTNMYTTVPNMGVFRDAYMIERIEDSDGRIIYQHEEKPEQIYSEETAYLMADMMRTVIEDGTARLIRSRFKAYGKIPVYGKTGTTSNDHDVWFVGFTPDVTLGVWTGYDQPSKLITGQGTVRSREIWSKIMNEAVDRKPEWFKTEKLERPPGITTATVSSVSGKLPTELTIANKLTTTDLINKKYLPVEEDDAIVKSGVIRYNKFNYIPQPGTPPDFIEEKVMIKRQKPILEVIEELRATFEKYPKSVPNKRGQPRKADDYVVADMHMDAPTLIDPRVDDGLAPPAPTGVQLERLDNAYRITFKPVDAEDVIGYRLYRSRDLAPFTRYNNLVVYTGDEPRFLAAIRSEYDAFYVTAVDVAGRESPASNVVYGGSEIDPMLLPPVGQGSGPSPGIGGNSGSSEPESPGDGAAGDGAAGVPAPPQGVRISAREDNFGILLQWNAADAPIKEYKVYYSSSPSGPYNLLGSTERTRFEYISFPSDGWYRVTAVNENGESLPSQAVEMKPAE